MSVPEVDAPAYTEEEKERLTENLRLLVEAIQRGELRDRPLHPSLLFDLHRGLFLGVRSHAGRPRGPGFGADVLRFGPRYSVPRKEVERQLDAAFRQLRIVVGEVESDPASGEYELNALRVALWAHTEVIRIHPFEDGNGRASRLLMDVLLARFGLRPIAIDAVRGEYIAALEEAFRGDDGPLLDLYLRLASDALG